MSRPEHVTEKPGGGYACLHCGGEVDESGESPFSAPDADDTGSPDETPQDEIVSKMFAKAVKERR